MGIPVRTAIVLAVLLAVTPPSFAQIAVMRAPRPVIAAPIEPALATPEQVFERLPQTTQQTLAALAAQEPLHDMELSPASTQALHGLAANGGDIESMVLVLLMLAARDAENDLRQIMAETAAAIRCSGESGAIVGGSATPAQREASSNSTLAAPESQRPRLNAIGHPPLVIVGAARANEPGRVGQAPNRECESEEAFQLRQLHLQMAMDRRAAAHEMLSGILRSQSEVQGQIVQNIK